jgi:hypothetical protein
MDSDISRHSGDIVITYPQQCSCSSSTYPRSRSWTRGRVILLGDVSRRILDHKGEARRGGPKHQRLSTMSLTRLSDWNAQVQMGVSRRFRCDVVDRSSGEVQHGWTIYQISHLRLPNKISPLSIRSGRFQSYMTLVGGLHDSVGSSSWRRVFCCLRLIAQLPDAKAGDGHVDTKQLLPFRSQPQNGSTAPVVRWLRVLAADDGSHRTGAASTHLFSVFSICAKHKCWHLEPRISSLESQAASDGPRRLSAILRSCWASHPSN